MADLILNFSQRFVHYDMCCKFVKVNDQFIAFQDYLVIEILLRQHNGIAVSVNSVLKSLLSVYTRTKKGSCNYEEDTKQVHQGARTTIIIFGIFQAQHKT